VGINIPGCDLRILEEEFKKNDVNHDGKLSIDEFSKVKYFLLFFFNESIN
jgi:hypothetical protein